MATPTPSQLAIATLYTAAFNRAPDAAGFDFWLQAYQRGASVSGLAATFLGTPEGQATYPTGLSSQAFVAAFYSSVFGRSADESGLRFWTNALDSSGGAGSASAKAALMVNIISVASTPITTKPDGLSDAAYAQTVADRARFINKAQFGVYFAAELRSNDLSLAKQMLALVTADPASLTLARTLAEQGGIPVTPPVTPPVVVPALTSADDVPTITSKLAAYAGTDATADTSGMDAAQLKAVAAGSSKFKTDGLSGTLALSSNVTSTEAGVLLAKYAGTTASANATGMDAAYLALLAGASTQFAAGSIATPVLVLVDSLLDDPTTEVLLAKSTGAQIDAAGATAAELLSVVNHIGAVAAGGITGTFALVGSLSAAQLTALLGKLATGAHVTADVSAMDASQLAVLAAKPLALDAGALTGTLNLSASLTGMAVAVLLNRYAGTDARLLATGAGSDVLNAAAATLSKVASISGDLAMLSDVVPGYGLILLDKYVGSSATVNASLYNSTQLQLLFANLNKLTAVTQPKLVLADAWLTSTVMDNLLAKSTGAEITATGASGTQLTSLIAKLSNIAADGIIGTLAISSTTAAATDLDALLQKTAVAATVNVNAASMDVDQIVLLFTHAAKIDTFTNLSVPSGVWAQLPADIGTLFTKAIGIRADLTGASAAQLKGVTHTPLHFGAGGLTGTFALDQSFDDSQLSALLGNAVNDAADVTVQATNMTASQLGAVALGIGKVDTILGLSLTPTNTAGLSATDIAGLLAKSSGVDASALSSSVLADALLSAADGVVKGTVAIGVAQFTDVGATRLENKLAATATLSITGSGGDDVIDLTNFTKQTYVTGGAGVDTITLGSGKGTVLIGGKLDSRSTAVVDTTQSTAASIDKIVGLKNGDVIKLSTDANIYGAGIQFTAQTTFLPVPVIGLSLTNGITFDNVYRALSVFTYKASTSTEASLLLISLTSSSGLSGTFLVVNDSNPLITADDTIIELTGTTSGLVYTV